MTATLEQTISYKNLTKTYGDKRAVDGLDVSFQKGELTALLGENGAGKTTSISLALGLVEPTEGNVTILGHKAGSIEARRAVGAMLQSAELPNLLTAEEHIKLFSSYYPNPVPIEELVEMLQLTPFLKQRYGGLSGGQKRRVQLALALCGNADFVILDEPTVGLDIETRHTLWQAVRACVARGQGVILTTHYLEEADALADRIVVMADGQLVADGTPAEIKALSAEKVIELQTNASADLIKTLPGVHSVVETGQTIKISVREAEPCLAYLFKEGFEVKDLKVSQVGLESAFLDITNKNKQSGSIGEAA
ncbi:ABC transporter ATP-binding protein [Kordiimonas sp. SCSIO 12603]|uniref:ABC transporter ATP-binding protein n=1 Tax=Kordiimonas sp. SCSIO 12603 TaxID=2829596 RepID=UPI002106F3B7|nr:ABC transporter ATP-binding protein [Kordiimonas sp. SCSIO 12603]UTW59246.1 ABC transporter ATP-binding protein [Kordiimonas sp. SCSIO 12603]